MSVDRTRLARLLGAPDLDRLRGTLRRQLESASAGGTVTLTGVGDAERHAIETLLGRRPRRGHRLRVAFAELEDVLQRSGAAPDLRTALEALEGPIIDRHAERAALDRRWAAVFDATAMRADALGLREWLEALRVRGLLTRAAGSDPERAKSLLTDALAVLERLPAAGITLSTLAAETLHDAHALDPGRPVAALVRRALVHRARSRGNEETIDDDRSLWASTGVLVGGGVTSTVLALNLPPPRAGDANATTGMIAAMSEAHEPFYLTLRQLLRDRPAWACGEREVFVCENPSVVAEAAERLGAAAPPLVATLGRPRAAALTLLDQLRAQGARLHYRGDLDWPGIAIANDVLTRFHAAPWRMDGATLQAHERLPGRALTGRPVEARWDPALAPALEARGAALQEEQLIDVLLDDLHRAG